MASARSAAVRAGALIQERRRQHGQAELFAWILRCARSHDHAHTDGGLFVMAHNHDLQTVGELADS